MSVTQNVVVRSRGIDALARFVTLAELAEFVEACFEAGGQPDDRLAIGGSLQFEVPSDEEREMEARFRATYGASA